MTDQVCAISLFNITYCSPRFLINYL